MPVEFIGMIATKDQSETRLTPRPDHRQGLHPAVRPRPRGRGIRPGADRLRVLAAGRHPGRGVRRRAQRAARLPGRAPARLRRADPRRPPVRHARPVQRRPDRGAHHHRRARRRAAPRRRLPVQGRALRPHRRVPGHRQAGLDVDRAVQLRRQVLPGRGPLVGRQVAAAAADQAVLRRLVRGGLPGRRQARRHLRPVGRAARRDQAADRRGNRRPGTPAASRPARHQRQLPADPRPDRGAGLGARAPDPRGDQGEHRRLPRPVGRQVVGPRRRQAGERRLAAAARRRRQGRAARPGTVDPAGRRDRRRRQLDRAGRHAGDGGAGAARLHRHRRHDDPDPRLRPLRRRDRLRPLPAAAGPRGGRPA